MSLFKRGKYYWYSFVFDGRRYQESTKLTNKEMARRAENARKGELAQARAGIVQRRAVPTLKEYSKQFLESVKLERADNTYRCYSISLGSLLPWFGTNRLDEITADEIQRFKESRLRKDLSPSTVNRDLACLRRIFSIAMKHDVLQTSPFIARKIEFLRETGHERVLTYDEERRYLAAAADIYKPTKQLKRRRYRALQLEHRPLLADIATIMLDMGLRPEEVFEIRPENVHFGSAEGPHLHIPDGKTENARRDVPMTERVIAILRARVRACQGQYVFPLRDGGGYNWNQPMKQINVAHQRALALANIEEPFRVYDLRHTFGTRSAESGVDPLTLCKLMGHSDLKTTQRYVHLRKSHLFQAFERIQADRAVKEIAEAERTQAHANLQLQQ